MTAKKLRQGEAFTLPDERIEVEDEESEDSVAPAQPTAPQPQFADSYNYPTIGIDK